ncbi:DUF1330 domain-containing protein [Paraburkholderia strydomiana]|uniref:hypothetical protein n=1 Tax=Paraburkholderia strydomiana TaxID=1245417 RepID=UPI00286B891F|nr:hypothetical protein [Paraburkholderia strydomiana]
MRKFSPKVIASPRQCANLEGDERHVVVEFDSFAEAKCFTRVPSTRRPRRSAPGQRRQQTFVLLEGAS